MTHPIHSYQTLLHAVRSGARPKYLFFWGHKPARPGSIDASCLSQWYPAPFVVEGVRYATAEHFMMAGKAHLFGDEAALTQILLASSPGKAKSIGRSVKSFDETLWNERRFEIVVAGNLAKFGQNPPLREFLLNTGDRILIEASPHDKIWGIGLAAEDQRASNPEQWAGLNLLGFALMTVRDKLR